MNPQLTTLLEPFRRYVLETGKPVINLEISGGTRAAPGGCGTGWSAITQCAHGRDIRSGEEVRKGPSAEQVKAITQSAGRWVRIVRDFLTLARQYPP